MPDDDSAGGDVMAVPGEDYPEALPVCDFCGRVTARSEIEKCPSCELEVCSECRPEPYHNCEPA